MGKVYVLRSYYNRRRNFGNNDERSIVDVSTTHMKHCEKLINRIYDCIKLEDFEPSRKKEEESFLHDYLKESGTSMDFEIDEKGYITIKDCRERNFKETIDMFIYQHLRFDFEYEMYYCEIDGKYEKIK